MQMDDGAWTETGHLDSIIHLPVHVALIVC
jgi:hypothetical protein